MKLTINNLPQILKIMLNCELYVNKQVFSMTKMASFTEYVFSIILMNFSILLRVRDSQLIAWRESLSTSSSPVASDVDKRIVFR